MLKTLGWVFQKIRMVKCLTWGWVASKEGALAAPEFRSWLSIKSGACGAVRGNPDLGRVLELIRKAVSALRVFFMDSLDQTERSKRNTRSRMRYADH